MVCLGFTACTDDFEELNTNPNSPVAVPTSYLITQAQRGLTDLVLGESLGQPGTLGMHYVQHLSQTQYTDVTRYDDIRTNFYPFYNGGLQDLQTVIDLNTDEETRGEASVSGSNDNQIALARVLQNWAFLNMTDVWGDIPYSEALMGVENLNPRYDTQEEIYRGVVSALVAAGDLIDESGSVAGDVLFGGDMGQVRRFANSLILRAGIRVSDVDPGLGEEWVGLALSRGVLESNADNVTFNYLGSGTPANNTYYEDFVTRTDYAVSEPLLTFMDGTGDPRVPVFAQPTTTSATSEDLKYVGMPYGITQEDAGNIDIVDVSFPGLTFISAASPAYLLVYSEVLFNQAEAAARGWTDGDAEALYESAIAASMEQFGVTDADALESFLDQEGVDYEEDNFEQLIGEQKWIALYFQGIEAWSEWRRLGFPELAPAPEPILINTIPTRRGYPDNEFTLNQDNYLEALQRQFSTTEDPLDGRVWWDVD